MKIFQQLQPLFLLFVPPWGQPMHLAPLLFSSTILVIDKLTITKIIKTTTRFIIRASYALNLCLSWAFSFPFRIK